MYNGRYFAVIIKFCCLFCIVDFLFLLLFVSYSYSDDTPDRKTFTQWDKKNLLYKTGVETDISKEMLKISEKYTHDILWPWF